MYYWKTRNNYTKTKLHLNCIFQSFERLTCLRSVAQLQYIELLEQVRDQHEVIREVLTIALVRVCGVRRLDDEGDELELIEASELGDVR